MIWWGLWVLFVGASLAVLVYYVRNPGAALQQPRRVTRARHRGDLR